MDLQETALIKKAQNGDQDAFSQLLLRYQAPIYNLSFRMTGSVEDAEEMTQIAFLNAWRGLPRFQLNSSFFTWLYRLASNACVDFLRHKKRQYSILHTVSTDSCDDDDTPPQIEDPRDTPEAQVLHKELQREITLALTQLSHEHREILLQREIESLSYQEIAEIQSLELGTVKSRIARARLSLRQILKCRGNFPDHSPSKETKSRKEGDSI